MVTTSDAPKGLGRRHLLSLLCFFYNGINFAQKVNLSVGIVIMMDNKDNSSFRQFDWSEFTRGLVLSSLYWGYTIAPIPGGFIAQHFGAKWPMFFMVMIGSILTILTPFIAALGWEYLCAARFFCGLMQGTSYPLFQTMLAKWLHLDERGCYTSLVFSGSKFGMALMLSLGGFIAGSSAGWPGIFYISGGFGILWCLLWWYFISETPAECKNISDAERNYLSNMTGRTETKYPAPWGKIWRSAPFWSTLFAQTTGSWGFYLLLNEIPTYIYGVFQLDIDSNGLMSSMPYFLMFALSLVFTYFANFLTTNRYVTIGVARKICNSIGMMSPGILLLVLAYSYEDTILSMVVLILAVGLNCGVNTGFLINFLDLSPNFVGYLMGISTFPANITSIVGPLFVGLVVTDISNPYLWQYVFWVTSIMYIAGNTVFVIFGSGEIQPWNEPNIEPKNTDSESAVSEKFSYVPNGEFKKSPNSNDTRKWEVHK